MILFCEFLNFCEQRSLIPSCFAATNGKILPNIWNNNNCFTFVVQFLIHIHISSGMRWAFNVVTTFDSISFGCFEINVCTCFSAWGAMYRPLSVRQELKQIEWSFICKFIHVSSVAVLHWATNTRVPCTECWVSQIPAWIKFAKVCANKVMVWRQVILTSSGDKLFDNLPPWKQQSFSY